MEFRAERVAVRGLVPTSLTVEPGQLALVRGEPGGGHTELGLVLTGRMRPASGLITVDGRADAAALRKVSALVDAPGVTEPDGSLSLAQVVGEELALSGRRGGRRQVRDWLAEHDLSEQAGIRVEALRPRVRIRALAELAAQPETRLLVLDQPDRHTGSVHDWWPLAQQLADRGHAVIVLCATNSVRPMRSLGVS